MIVDDWGKVIIISSCFFKLVLLLVLQNRLHLRQVVQSSVPILSVLALSALGPVKHTHTQRQTESKDNEASTIR